MLPLYCWYRAGLEPYPVSQAAAGMESKGRWGSGRDGRKVKQGLKAAGKKQHGGWKSGGQGKGDLEPEAVGGRHNGDTVGWGGRWQGQVACLPHCLPPISCPPTAPSTAYPLVLPLPSLSRAPDCLCSTSPHYLLYYYPPTCPITCPLLPISHLSPLPAP